MNTWNRGNLPLAAVSLLLMSTMLVLFPIRPKTTQADGILRLHILANSDAEADQAVKLLVRDAVLAFLPESASEAEAESYLLTHGKELQAIVENTLRENGMDYGATLMLGVSTFPDRDYGGVTYPAGDYRALRILLGRGAGHNWWCVLFPPLCIVSDDERVSTSPDGETEIEFHSSIADWWRTRRSK